MYSLSNISVAYLDAIKRVLKLEIALLGSDEEWMHSDAVPDTRERQQELIMYQPPSEEQLAAVRERRLQEKEMYTKLKKLVYYVSVLFVLLVVSKGNRDAKSYSFRRSLEDGIIEPPTRIRKLEHVSFICHVSLIVQIKHKNCKNQKYVQKQSEHHH